MTLSTPVDGRSIRLRAALPSDEELLFRFFSDARAEEFKPLGLEPGRLEALLRSQFAAQFLDYTANYPNAVRRIVLLRGHPVGLMWIDHRANEIRLLDFIVAAEHRNAGIGTRLLRRLQRDASRAGLPLRHMVAVNNPRARRLYERCGFRVAGDAGSHFLMEWLPATRATPGPSAD